MVALSNYARIVYAWMREQYIQAGYVGADHFSVFTHPLPSVIPSGWQSTILTELEHAGYVNILSLHDVSTYGLALPIRYGLQHQYQLREVWYEDKGDLYRGSEIDEEITSVTCDMENLCAEIALGLLSLKEHKKQEDVTGLWSRYEVILSLNRDEYRGIYGPIPFKVEGEEHLAALRTKTKHLLLALFQEASGDHYYEDVAEALLPIKRVAGRPGGMYRVDRWVFSCLPFPKFDGYHLKDAIVTKDPNGDHLRAYAELRWSFIAYVLCQRTITFSLKQLHKKHV